MLVMDFHFGLSMIFDYFNDICILVKSKYCLSVNVYMANYQKNQPTYMRTTNMVQAQLQEHPSQQFPLIDLISFTK